MLQESEESVVESFCWAYQTVCISQCWGDPLFLKERTGRQVWGTWTPDQWFSKIKEQVKEPTLNSSLFASSFKKSTRKNWGSSKKTSARIYFTPFSSDFSV
jgi:hypothetical protein